MALSNTLECVRQLEDMMAALNDVLKVDELFRVCQRILNDFTSVNYATLYVLRPDGKQEKFVVSPGLNDSESHAVRNMYADLDIAGILSSEDKLNPPSAGHRAREITLEKTSAANPDSILSLTIPGKSASIGFLSIARKTAAPFSEDEIALLTFLAKAIGLACERIFENEKQKKKIDELKLFERALHAAANGVIFTDPKKKDNPLVYCNPAFEKITGYSMDDVKGRNLRFLHGAETDNSALAEIRSCVTEMRECTVTLQNYRKDGSRFWNELHISPVFDENEQLGCFIGIQNDVTGKVKFESALKNVNLKLKTLIANLQEGVLVEDNDRRLLIVNNMFLHLFGFTEDADVLVGADCAQRVDQYKDLFVDGEKFVARIETLLAGNKLELGEEVKLIDGRIFERDFIPITSGESELGSMWVYRDITEKKETQQKLIQDERNHRIINHFSTSIMESNTEEDILSDIVSNCISSLGFQDCAVYMYAEDGNSLVRKAALVTEAALECTHISTKHDLIHSVAVGGESEVVDNVKQDNRYSASKHCHLSEIGVPIISEDEVIGVINSRHLEKGFFTKSLRKVLELIASQAANKLARVRSLRRTKENEEKYRNLFDHSNDGILLHDLDGVIHDINAKALQLFDLPVNGNRPEKLDQIYKEAYILKREKIINTLKSKGEASYEFSHESKNGELVQTEITSSLFNISGKTIVQDIIRNITARKKSALALQESEARKSAILESALDCIITADHNSKIIEFNPAAEKTFGFRKKDVVGKYLFETIIPHDLREAHKSGMEKYLKEGVGPVLGKRIEIIALRADGTIIPIELAITAISTGSSKIFTAYIRDISERKKVEESLKENDRIKTDFVSSVSHELRTPLASILGFTSTILQNKNLDAETTEEFIKIVYDESQRLSRLIENVLNVSKIESGDFNYDLRPLAFDEIFNDVYSTLKINADEKGVALSYERDESLPLIEADQDAIKQVAINLLSNAIKFTPEGGEVNVAMRHLEDELILEVQDTGLGIPEADQSKIFDKFYRVYREGVEIQGTGLGLSISKEIVAYHKGRIELNSEENKGTLFSVYLPASVRQTNHADSER